ncbi:MAG: type II 3-dehydroquinate dehydratase [Cyanobacteria bacterium HKST-UBA06]|nr:type II 3-dehydroquinate dehydratase [Cyanobacteria bacterium HKST-UBA06]
MSNTTTAHVGKHDHTILVVHGPNLNMLGTREPDVYGTQTLDDINRMLVKVAERREVNLVTYQSNIEGDIITVIQQYASKSDGLIINPAGYTHTSVAIRDALVLYPEPIVEVHLSNIYNREDFRKDSLMSPVTTGTISGFGADSYRLALMWLAHILEHDDQGH